jgi:hypothetical protein
MSGTVTSSFNGTNYVFALPTLDISGDFDERPTFEVTDDYSTISADVLTTSTIDISASHMKTMFQVFTDSSLASFDDVSANDFYYRTRGGADNVTDSVNAVDSKHKFAEDLTLAFGDQTCTTGANTLGTESNIKVNLDYARHLAKEITGTIRGVDLFSNEDDISGAWAGTTGVDASVITGFRRAFSNHNEWAKHAVGFTTLASPAQHILTALLRDASGVERVLDEISGNAVDYDLLSGPNAGVDEDLSGALFELPLVAGDTIVAKVTIRYKGQIETGDAGAYQVWDNSTGANGGPSAQGAATETQRNISTRSYLIKFNLVAD